MPATRPRSSCDRPLETDNARCGLLPFAFKPDFQFRDYAEWALDIPMFFLVRGGVYRPVRDDLTFRRFLAEGFEGERASMSDWEIHLSTLFPEVRLKRTIEVRGADATPLPLASACPSMTLVSITASRLSWSQFLGAFFNISSRYALNMARTLG